MALFVLSAFKTSTTLQATVDKDSGGGNACVFNTTHWKSRAA